MAAPSTPPAPTPPVTISSVLRTPEVASTLAMSVLARLPFGAMGLLLVLRLTESHYSYGQAGLAAAAYALALALGSPFVSRVIDRDGQTRILLITALTGGGATAALALVPAGSPLLVFILLAAVNGVLQPPLAGTMRGLWDLLLTREDERHVGFALEASAVELVFTGGPLVLVGVIAAAFGPQIALLTCALLTGGGTIAFAFSGPSRRWRPAAVRERHPFGALGSPGVRTLMLVCVGAGVMFGSIELGVTAFGRKQDDTSLIGIMLAIWSIGSLVGGLLIAQVRPARDPAGRIVVLLLLLGIASAALALATSTAALIVLLVVAGLGIAPTFATLNGLMGRVSPPGMLTEAFGWTTSAVMVGLTIGSPAAGFLIDHVSVHAAFCFSGVPLLAAAGAVWALRASLAPNPADAPLPAE